MVNKDHCAPASRALVRLYDELKRTDATADRVQVSDSDPVDDTSMEEKLDEQRAPALESLRNLFAERYGTTGTKLVDQLAQLVFAM